jgi:23S rRNA pseudouridine1911/1915/1917 synthase
MTTPTTILDLLIARYPQAKKGTLRDMVEGNRIVLNGIAVKSLKQIVTNKDKLEFSDTAVSSKVQMLDEHLRLVYQDADLLIVDKPAGLLTATDAKEKRPTVQKILSDYVQRANHKALAKLVHRLDRDASGLLVFARNEKTYDSLKEQFYKHTVTRQYDVLVHGVPAKPAAKLEHILQEDPKTGQVRITPHARLGKHAILDYQLVASGPGRKAAHLRVTLHTGRKHQIRVQLRAVNHSVLGDPIYGLPIDRLDGGPIGRLALHASVLAFEHPRKHGEVRFDSPIPRAFTKVMQG